MVSDSKKFEIADSIAGDVIETLPAAIDAISELVHTMETTPEVDPVFLLSVEAMGANMTKVLDSVETRNVESLIAGVETELDLSSARVISNLPPALKAIDGLVQSMETLPHMVEIVDSVEVVHNGAAAVLASLESGPVLR